MLAIHTPSQLDYRAMDSERGCHIAVGSFYIRLLCLATFGQE